ncbi:carboxypeptidase-like regulatory domain-containing protein [Pseudacidobacterium ailaaui]|uniref:carboxypeptidase-like regulatory domain-containing protein n=1 Tax=Pseudacidobacterium ailaaui TaxID=1382359 RepID=UPI00138DFC27|nr:carboxypeptidase-like regulatory domain-containing protein [Pseudacidobacterium ailaaui]
MLRTLMGAFASILIFTSVSSAQVTNATLTGTVADTTGAAVPGAHFHVENSATNASQDTVTNASGVYNVGRLLPGPYTVTVDANGFKRKIQTEITLTVGQNATVDIALEVGSTNETVTVTGGAALVNTTNSEISQVIGENSVKELPLNGRNPANLVFLTPGISNVMFSTASKLQGGQSLPDETGASAGGGRQGSTYYLLDGAPNMNTYLLLAAPFPNSDATQEFKVISNNFDARYGFAPNAVVSVQTKSGTNQIHGDLFEFIRNNNLNAANYFSHAVDSLKRNQFGGDVGGPILKDKLFFFVNYQGTRESTNAARNTTYTPTQAMLNGDFSAVPTTLKAPFATVNGKPNQVNPALFNSAAVTIATTALPLGQTPATGLTNYAGPAQHDSYNEGTARIDYTINDNQHLFVRSFTQYYNQKGGSVNGNILAWLQAIPGKYFNEAIGHTWAINAKTLNNITLDRRTCECGWHSQRQLRRCLLLVESHQCCRSSG